MFISIHLLNFVHRVSNSLKSTKKGVTVHQEARNKLALSHVISIFSSKLIAIFSYEMFLIPAKLLYLVSNLIYHIENDGKISKYPL